MSFTFTNPSLDPIPHGAGIFTVPANSTKSDYYLMTIDFMFNGLEFFSNQTDIGDHVEFRVEYTIDGGETWLLFKKFSKKFYVSPKILNKAIFFAANPKNGMRFHFKYTNVSANEIKYFVNLYSFLDYQNIDPSAGEQGIDW